MTDVLAEKARRALSACAARGTQLTGFAVAGGVAANRTIRARLEEVAGDVPFLAPPLELCTDNAAMIAWAGIERLRMGQEDPLDFVARPRWPLDPEAEAVRGAGVKA